VSVCPTECRIFGDLDDPESDVSRLLQRTPSAVRKPEKMTGPKIFYLGAEEAVIRPETATRPLIYKEGRVHLRPLGAPAPDPADPGAARVDYDTPHAKPWGADMVLYLAFKAIATGAMLLSALLWWAGYRDGLTGTAGAALSVVFISLTAVVLVIDLERPERFYYILTRSNWRSWMVWGAWFLTAHGVVSVAWLAAYWFGWAPVINLLIWPTVLIALLATSYTGFLFAQGRGRDLWQGPAAAVDLVAQSGAAGAAALLLASALAGAGDERIVPLLGRVLAASLAIHLAILLYEHLIARSPTRHHALAVETIRRGAYARLFWGAAIVGGGVLPLALLTLTAASSGRGLMSLAALLALAGGAAWEYIWVEAGQSVPLS
jgi:formate-dependent nitrite reductase membrane component NrfD